jgi:hypothetical protein
MRDKLRHDEQHKAVAYQRPISPEMREQRKRERKQAADAAATFVRICARGNADQLYDAHQWLNECTDSQRAWSLAMLKVARLRTVDVRIQGAFLRIWAKSKMLPLRVGKRRVLASALRVPMPADYKGEALTLYRGTVAREYHYRYFGFSCTTDAALARNFVARVHHSELESEAVLLRTVAPRDAILVVRNTEGDRDDGEVVVDPCLGNVELIERLSCSENDREVRGSRAAWRCSRLLSALPVLLCGTSTALKLSRLLSKMARSTPLC